MESQPIEITQLSSGQALSINMYDVSVVIAVKNEEKHIQEALASVCSQTGVRAEVLVIDDRSNDQTRGLVLKMLEKYENLSLFDNPCNGKVSAFNLGVKMAKGRFVCLFSGDDLMPPGSLAARYESVQSAKDNLPLVGLSKLTIMSEAYPRLNGVVIPRSKRRSSLSGVSPLMNHAACKRIFPIPEYLPNEDSWIALCLTYFKDITLIHCDVICCRWRLHVGNSVNVYEEYAVYTHKVRVRNKALEHFLNRYGHVISPKQRMRLENAVALERRRSAGDVLGVLFSSAPLVERLRALSSTTSYFHWFRRRFFTVFSGW